MNEELQQALVTLSACARRSDLVHKNNRLDEVKYQLAAVEAIRNLLIKLDSCVILSYEEALAAGLVHCECGHPPNNHFDFDDKPCAHCSCKCFKQKIRNTL
jgi:hypothetical protein